MMQEEYWRYLIELNNQEFGGRMCFSCIGSGLDVNGFDVCDACNGVGTQ